MTEFTPISATVGGVLIGMSACLLLWLNGRIAGISGIAAGALARKGDRFWRFSFLVGLLLGGAGWMVFHGPGFEMREGFPLGLVGTAGVIVGFGTRLGSGCTSGHGICGLGRLSPRSLAATLLFVGFGMLTVYLTRHWLQAS